MDRSECTEGGFMRTQIIQNGEITIVTVSGRLDIDKAPLFKQACLNQLKGRKVIFSLQDLSFVGSTGISQFFQTLQEVNQLNEKSCRIVGLGADFRRITDYTRMHELEIHESLESASLSFATPRPSSIE